MLGNVLARLDLLNACQDSFGALAMLLAGVMLIFCEAAYIFTALFEILLSVFTLTWRH